MMPWKLFERWTRTQQKLRDAKGSLRIQSKETKFTFDENHEVTGVVEDPRYFSNTLIEETALAANQAVGDAFHERGLPTIYRVHPEKDPEEMIDYGREVAYLHKPSMLQDVEARRQTEIDNINGGVAAIGDRIGVPCPLNTAIAKMIKGLEHSWTLED